jgi:hypothetical protein
LKYLVVGSLRSISLMPTAKRKGVFSVLKFCGSTYSKSVVFDVIDVFSKVVKNVLVKIAIKIIMRVIETSPPLRDSN